MALRDSRVEDLPPESRPCLPIVLAIRRERAAGREGVAEETVRRSELVFEPESQVHQRPEGALRRVTREPVPELPLVVRDEARRPGGPGGEPPRGGDEAGLRVAQERSDGDYAAERVVFARFENGPETPHGNTDDPDLADSAGAGRSDDVFAEAARDGLSLVVAHMGIDFGKPRRDSCLDGHLREPVPPIRAEAVSAARKKQDQTGT